MPVILKGRNGNEIKTYALLDSGSRVSLVRKVISKKLGLRGKKKFINVGKIKDEPEKLSVSDVNLVVMFHDGNVNVEIKNAYSMPRSSFKMPSRSKFSGYFEGLEKSDRNFDRSKCARSIYSGGSKKRQT